MATRAGSVPLEMVGELLTYQVLLRSTQDHFRLLEAKTHALDLVTQAFNRVDRYAERQCVGRFDQHLDGEFHRAPPRMSPWPVWPVHD